MRGTDRQTGHMFSYLSPEALVPKEHPLRLIRPLANAALERLSASFHQMYSVIGRPSIPPEQLLRLPPPGVTAARISRASVWPEAMASITLARRC